MKFKRMPVFYSDVSSPLFIVLATFLMCGAVIGAFTSVYVPNFDTLNYEYQIYPRDVLLCVVDVLKFNVLLIIFSKFCGFLIPVYVLARGYALSFSIGVIYANSGGFFDKSILLESISYNIFAVPCFLFIATSCFNIYVSHKNLKSKNSRRRQLINYNYRTVLLLIFLNFGWNIVCMSVFS